MLEKWGGGVNYPDEYDDIVNRNIGTSEDKTLLYIALASDNKNFNLPTNPIYDKMFVSFESKKINPQYKNLFTIENYKSISLPYVVLLKDGSTKTVLLKAGSTKTIYGIAKSSLINPSILKPDFIIVKIEPDLLTLYKESKRKIQQRLYDGEKIDITILPQNIIKDITITID